MATMSKTAITVVITTKQGATFTAADDFANNTAHGQVAFHNVREHETIEIIGDGSTVYVPWHNVGYATVSKSTSTETVTDDVCDEGSESEDSGDDGNNSDDSGN